MSATLTAARTAVSGLQPISTTRTVPVTVARPIAERDSSRPRLQASPVLVEPRKGPTPSATKLRCSLISSLPDGSTTDLPLAHFRTTTPSVLHRANEFLDYTTGFVPGSRVRRWNHR